MSNIEENIKRCEKLTEPQNANWIGISNQLAIAHMIDRIKELEAKLEFKKWGDLDNTQFEEYMNQFIPKQKVKDKIEELNNNRPYLMKFEDWRKKEYTNEDIIRNCIEVLQELLEEK